MVTITITFCGTPGGDVAIRQCGCGSTQHGVTKTDLQEMEERIMATQAEAAATLQGVVTTLSKVSTETTELLAKIAALEEAAANSPLTPELEAAINAVVNQGAALDAIYESPTPPTEPPTQPQP